MSTRGLVEARSFQEPVSGHSDSFDSQLEFSALKALSLRSLVSLFQEEEKLFSGCATLTEGGFHREGTSRKRTMIALLGLQRLAEAGGAQPFDLASIRDAVLEDTSWVRSVGDLGLLTWFTAVCVPERLGRLFNEFDFGKALDAYSDGRQARTVGLAWFLAGIGHARLACPGTLPDMTDIAVDTYHMLQDNQGEGGIFGHIAFPRLVQRPFYNRLGTFADQIHAIYGLTTFARAFQIEEPLASALACANSVCALQGEMGQWWFLYDKRTSRVVNPYPVISHHQDGTAPAGLLALGDATGRSFHKPILKGLSWIAGANELGKNLRNLDQGFIWDSIGPSSRITNYVQAVLSFLSISYAVQGKKLSIRYEARPDHFGWLLYALARFGAPNATMAAKGASTHGCTNQCV